jgi:hypothetical protein
MNRKMWMHIYKQLHTFCNLNFYINLIHGWQEFKQRYLFTRSFSLIWHYDHFFFIVKLSQFDYIVYISKDLPLIMVTDQKFISEIIWDKIYICLKYTRAISNHMCRLMMANFMLGQILWQTDRQTDSAQLDYPLCTDHSCKVWIKLHQ